MGTGVKRDYVPAADGLRTLCVAGVAIYHYWQQSWLDLSIRVGSYNVTLMPVIRSGYALVDLLLMLSGFVLFLPYVRAQVEGQALPNTYSFYKRRALRTLPSYYLSVFIVLFCFAIPLKEYSTSAALWKDLIPHLTLTHTFFRESYVHTLLNGVLWTLGIELQAYLLFPLLARVFLKKPVLCYVGLTLIGWGFRLFICRMFTDLTPWINQLPAFFDVYANGMLAAWCYVHWSPRKRILRILSTLGACAALFGLWRLLGAQSRNGLPSPGLQIGQAWLRYPLTMIGAAWLLFTAWGWSWFQRIFANRFIRFFAGISFQYYIWHQYLAVRLRTTWRFPPYEALENPQFAGEQPWQWQYMLVCILLSLLVAILFTYGFERPISRIRRRISYDYPGTPASSANHLSI